MKFLLTALGYFMTIWPYSWQLACGRALGRLAYLMAKKRRVIAMINIHHCFPELSPRAQKSLCLKNFEGIGMGLAEAFAAWFMSERRVRKIPFTWIGKENYEAALKTGKGIIALSAHFTCIEMIGRIFGKFIPTDLVYKPSHNRVVDAIIVERRLKYAKGLLKHSNMKAMVSALRHKKLIWFAPDQDFGRVQAEFVPFCGVPAATIPAVSILAKLGDAVIMPIFFRRTEQGGYEFITLPLWEHFPSGDKVADIKRYNDQLTDFVKQYPADYFWIHRRFKTVESGENIYQAAKF